MSLINLPVEILEIIFSHFDNPNNTPLRTKTTKTGERYSSLHAVALTCHVLSKVAVSVLYKHIEIVPSTPPLVALGLTVKLNKSCRADPSIANRIQIVSLVQTNPAEPGSYNELLGHLAKSTSLIRLKLHIGCEWAQLTSLYDHTGGSFSRLRELTVIEVIRPNHNRDSLPVDRVVKLCELPSLEKLTIRARVTGFGTHTGTVPTAVISKLRQLQFLGSFPVSIAALESILPRALNLKCLELDTVPGEAIVIHGSTTRQQIRVVQAYQLQGPVRPSSYGDLLAPIAARLTSLRLNANNLSYEEHDETRVDLSGFENIRCLELGACLLFGSNPSAASCTRFQKVWSLLPPRLDELSIRFDGDQGFFWSLSDAKAHTDNFAKLWRKTSDDSRVDWLIDLLEMKRKDIIAFKTITIREQVMPGGGWDLTMEPCQIRHLEAAATAAGVQLYIILRIPTRFITMTKGQMVDEDKSITPDERVERSDIRVV
ncbi:hypothetical protein GGR54DRAFT_448894 [Hypoxylon sp. NC1633]|nr:hypothetical protein GGR54DRAFT_448894 [Hypoxylon sp. NC1633]